MSSPELDRLFRELLASNHGPGYGIVVTAISSDLSVIDAELRFLTGRSYCCAEPGCHLPSDCERLIRLAAQHSIRLAGDVLVRWHCIVEEGARLQCLGVVGLSTETHGYAYDAITGGREGPTEHEPPAAANCE